MDIIQKKDIKFFNLRKLSCTENSEGNLYHDRTKVYKIFKDSYIGELINKEEKLKMLYDGDNLQNVVLPIEIIKDENKLCGYTMNYIREARELFYYDIYNKDIKILIKMVQDVSKILRNIHNDPRDIIIGDLSFGNIIFNKEYKTFFIDIDSCGIGGFNPERIPLLLYIYLRDKSLIPLVDQNSDRISLVLEFFQGIFLKTIYDTTLNEYDELSEKIKTLSNMRDLFVSLKYEYVVPEVPYIDEFIDKRDFENNDKILLKRNK